MRSSVPCSRRREESDFLGPNQAPPPPHVGATFLRHALESHHPSIRAGRIQAGAHYHLGLERSFRPGIVQMARADFIGKVAKAIRLLGSGVTMAPFRDGNDLRVGLHAKITSSSLKSALPNLKRQFPPRKRQHKISHFHVAPGASNNCPLLELRYERAVEF